MLVDPQSSVGDCPHWDRFGFLSCLQISQLSFQLLAESLPNPNPGISKIGSRETNSCIYACTYEVWQWTPVQFHKYMNLVIIHDLKQPDNTWLPSTLDPLSQSCRTYGDRTDSMPKDMEDRGHPWSWRDHLATRRHQLWGSLPNPPQAQQCSKLCLQGRWHWEPAGMTWAPQIWIETRICNRPKFPSKMLARYEVTRLSTISISHLLAWLDFLWIKAGSPCANGIFTFFPSMRVGTGFNWQVCSSNASAFNLQQVFCNNASLKLSHQCHWVRQYMLKIWSKMNNFGVKSGKTS